MTPTTSTRVAEIAGTHTASAEAAGDRPAHVVSGREVPVRELAALITDGVGTVGVIGRVGTENSKLVL
ncbi:MAG TPA: hypothetical protein VFS56_09290 [Gemmatimonadaceae bacterium]|nr:hypothetical protein [Gemmatimonadaceae bacterium]